MTVKRYEASRYSGMIPSEKGCWVRYVDIKRTRECDASIREHYINLIKALNEKIDRRNTLIKFQEAEILGLTIKLNLLGGDE